MTRVAKDDISLDLEFWVEELSPAQLQAYERVANEHNAVKNALKTALSANEGKELFNGQVFQAYSFKGKVLQEIKEAALPKKAVKAAEPAPASAASGRGRKRQPNAGSNSNIAYMESSDEEDDDVPLAKRIALSAGKKSPAPTTQPSKALKKSAAAAVVAATSAGSKTSTPVATKGSAKLATKPSPPGKAEKGAAAANAQAAVNFRPSEINSVGGLVVGTNDNKKDGKDGKDGKETKMQGKTYPSLVVLAKPYLKVKDMAATRSKLDSKVKLVLMLTPNKFCEWLIQEGLLRTAQNCTNHRNNELKLGLYSDATKFPFTGGYVWISECCPMRFVSVFHNSIFEGAQHPPSCILKLMYHWACQTSIQNVVQWVKVDSVYIKGIYTWLRAICTLAVHQKCKKLGGPEKFVEVGVISLGTTSQDGAQRQVKVEVLGVYDYADKSIRLRAVEPIADGDRNYKKRFQTILEPLQRWVHKESVVCIDLTVDKITLYSMGFKNIVQAAATDNNAKHNNSAVMEYLRRIVPRMFQNTLSLLSRQMIQQFLDELVWRENFGTYALQAFNSIASHIAEQTRVIANETLTQRLYQVATNPFKDWSVVPTNFKETPASHKPKRLKKPINDSDYLNLGKDTKHIKKENRSDSPTPVVAGKRRGGGSGGASADVEEHRPEKKSAGRPAASSKQATPAAAKATPKGSATAPAKPVKKPVAEVKPPPVVIKKEEDELKGLEEMYYGVCDGHDAYFENFPYTPKAHQQIQESDIAKFISCSLCNIDDVFDSNEKFQTHLVSHINQDGKEHQFQCLFCLEKHQSEEGFDKHNQIMHPSETKTNTSPSYYCLICQQRHNSLNHLTAHLQKVHNMLELPYWCQTCGYRSSSHRDVVRHFYDDHKNQNFLQCPFCLDVYYFCQKGTINQKSIETYFMHLQSHMQKKEPSLRCQKCALNFLNKGALKQHVAHHHISMTKNPKQVRILTNNSLLIPFPKVRTHHREPLPYTQQRLPSFFAFIEGSICAECNSMIVCEDKHFHGLLKCNKCNFKSCCERALFNHAASCNGTAFLDGMEISLPNEMHCICGFATANGNKMAHHIATCGQKTCYPSVERAHENTVKRNMLDMLGLVRRDGESGEVGGADEEGPGVGDETINESAGGDVVEQEQQQQQQQQQQQEHQADNQLHGELEQQHEPQQQQQHQYDDDLPAQAAHDVVSEALQDNMPQDQEPIQFGEMEAAPVMLETDQQVVADDVSAANADYAQIVDEQQQQQYTLNFGPTEVQGHALTASDIDMPLIGELADPNPPPTPQFLSEVHTPMFDAVAAAEQQHYHQIMHAQQQQQQQHLHHQQQQQHHHQQHHQQQ